jgi:hypothetical protein
VGAATIACILLAVVGCSSDLVAPSAPAPFVQDAVLVRPFVRVIDENGEPVRDVEVRIDSGFYRSGAGLLSFVVDSEVGAWPRAVPAPFVLELRRYPLSGRGSGIGPFYWFDAFPADGETLVVDLRQKNAFVRVDLPPSLPTSDVEVDRVTIGVEVTNRSAHVEVDVPRTRYYEFACAWVDTMLFATELPADAGDTWYARAEWSTLEGAPGPSVRGSLEDAGPRTPGELRLGLVSRAVPMELRLTWADGAFAVEDFSYETFPRIRPVRWEYLRVGVRGEHGPALVLGIPGDVTFAVWPTTLRAVLGAWTTRSWNGVDPVHIELGQHACTVRVVDANGRPRAFEAFQLHALSADLHAAEQTSDASGRMLWYVNDGEYVLVPSDRVYDDLAPRGGPWRVTSDTTLVWEMP